MYKKLMFYEVKRLMANKLYLGFLLLVLVYGWEIFRGVILFGVNHTAPFSALSFGTYLLCILPVISVVLVLFLAKMRNRKEQKVQLLFFACPVEPKSYIRMRAAAALLAAGMLFLAAIVEILVIYKPFYF